MHTYRCRKGAYSAGATSTREVESYARQEPIGGGLKKQKLELGRPTGMSMSATLKRAPNTAGTAVGLWARRVT